MATAWRCIRAGPKISGKFFAFYHLSVTGVSSITPGALVKLSSGATVTCLFDPGVLFFSNAAAYYTMNHT